MVCHLVFRTDISILDLKIEANSDEGRFKFFAQPADMYLNRNNLIAHIVFQPS